MAGTTFNIGTNKYITGQVIWTSRSNGTAANSSTVTATLQIKKTNTYTTWGNWPVYITINGNKKEASPYFEISNSWVTVLTHTVTVPHNVDGTKVCSIGAFCAGVSESTTEGANITKTQSVVLDTIPQASSISVPASAYINDAISININRASTAFTHKLAYSTNGSTYTSIATAATTSYSWTLPNTLYTLIPNNKELTITFSCETYNGSTKVGATTYATLKAQAKEADAAPEIYSGTVAASDAVTLAMVGNGSKLIRYISTANCTLTGTAKAAAYLSAAKVNNKSYTLGSNVSVINNTLAIEKIDTGTFAFSLTDSRGYSDTATTNIELIPYIPLTINPEVRRTTITGDSVTLTIKGNFKAINFGAKTNTLTLKYASKLKSATTWGTDTTIAASNILIDAESGTYTATVTISGFNYLNQYSFRFTGIDADSTNTYKLTELQTEVELAASLPIFSWGKDIFKFNVPLIPGEGAATVGTSTKPFSAGYFTDLYRGGKRVLVEGEASLPTLTANRAVISNSTGNLAVSAVTSTELSYLDGVTSSIQTQLNARTLQNVRVLTGSMSQNTVLSGTLSFTPRFFCIVFYDGGWYTSIVPLEHGFNGTEFRYNIYNNYHRYKLRYSGNKVTLTKTGSGTCSTYLEAYS